MSYTQLTWSGAVLLCLILATACSSGDGTDSDGSGGNNGGDGSSTSSSSGGTAGTGDNWDTLVWDQGNWQ